MDKKTSHPGFVMCLNHYRQARGIGSGGLSLDAVERLKAFGWSEDKNDSTIWFDDSLRIAFFINPDGFWLYVHLKSWDLYKKSLSEAAVLEEILKIETARKLGATIEDIATYSRSAGIGEDIISELD